MIGSGTVVCFGEMLLRLSPTGRGHLFQEPLLGAHFGGAEANVAVALARLGIRSALVGAVPTGPIGEAALDSVRRAGVDTSGVKRGDGRLGIYFLATGAGLRRSEIVYDRLDSVFARTPSEAYDWPALLKNASVLHLSGIIPAIGPEAARLSLDAIAAANAAGVLVSFDCNYRASMWGRWCEDPAPILARHVAGADILFGSHRDISFLLGKGFSGNDPERRREAAEAAFDAFPRLATIASTARHIAELDRHLFSGRVDLRAYGTETGELEIFGVVDRIGTGDAFVAGVLASLDDGAEHAAARGLELAALAHSTPGDQSFTTRADLDAFNPAIRDVRR